MPAGRLVICLLAAFWLGMPACSALADDPPPNVVLIISDDHGWRDYGFMGHPHVQTPRLDRLASESLVFRRGCTPCSLCCPSLASIITGLCPHQHGITGNDPPRPAGAGVTAAEKSAAFSAGREIMNRQLEAVPTLPRLLAKRGYLSFQTGKWWQGDYTRGGFTHGMTRGDRHGDAGLEIGRQTMRPIYDFIADARQQRKPFLVWYAPMLPHSPHNPPQRLLDKYLDQTRSIHIARYWAMIEWFDETCGQLLDHLDEQHLASNTIVLYISDNGWIQRADDPRYAPKSKTSPYDTGVHTPIMVRWPGRVKPRESTALASSLDLVPTILHAVGEGERITADMSGLDLLDDRAMLGRKTVFGECFLHTTADPHDPAANLLWRWALQDRWRLIVPRGHSQSERLKAVPDDDHIAASLLANAAQDSVELYDLLADPAEEQNVADDNPRVVEEMLGQLDDWWLPK
ncbi:MAG: sulfatase-like hydrolase/transferase [Pirellulales bacterium]